MSIILRKLASDLREIGVEERFALDIASVVVGIRPRGLLHISRNLRTGIVELFHRYGLGVGYERELDRTPDEQTREAILTDRTMHQDRAELWLELWYQRTDQPLPSADFFLRDTGIRLSYPVCCVEAMRDKSSLASHYRSYIFASDSGRHWQLNRLSALFSKFIMMPDFFPCHLACSHANNFVEPFVSLAADIWGPDTQAEMVRRAQQPIFLWKDWVLTFGQFSVVDQCVRVERNSGMKVPLSTLGIYRHFTNPALLFFQHLPLSTVQERRLELYEGTTQIWNGPLGLV